MSEQAWLEILGYAASVLVAISLTMSSILRLRVINLIGAATFAIYGWLIGAIPVAMVNLFIVFINIYYLRGMLRSREYFRVLPVAPTSDYVRYFLNFHEDQIARFLPHTKEPVREADLCIFVLRDLMPAGLFMGKMEGSTLRVTLDFVIPRFRDFKVGRHLFVERADFFRERGITAIVSEPGSRPHTKYLRRMGFREMKDAGGDELYRLPIT